MNYSEMTDLEINRAVGDASGVEWARLDSNYHPLSIWNDGELCVFCPCNSWTDAGPIIATNKISLDFDEDGFEPPQNAWCKASSPCGEVYYGSENEPLRAAMIVFLMMQEKPDA